MKKAGLQTMSRKCSLLVLLAALLCSSGCHRSSPSDNRAETRVVIDMVGRQVPVPLQIHRVYGMSPMGTILVYTLDPSLLVGWNYQPAPGEKALLLEPYRDLPVLGGWFGKDSTGNLEKIMQARPDVLISMGDPLGTAQAERVQGQTHIPVFVIKGGLENLPAAYQKAGELLGNAPRAALLAAECRQTLDDITQKISSIPLKKRRRYYYAEGPKGQETEPAGSSHAESMNFAGGMNVAAGVEEQKGYGHSPVSMEQVLRWNPEVVITGYDHLSSPGEFYTDVWIDPRWKNVAAVRNREVYETPQYPFCWIDRPPSVNRIIGIKWLANMFYPELFQYDMRNETRHFYEKFYHIKVTEAQLDEILATAVRKPAGKSK
jgi:iron complex transport system substrate-binding protein